MKRKNSLSKRMKGTLSSIAINTLNNKGEKLKRLKSWEGCCTSILYGGTVNALVARGLVKRSFDPNKCSFEFWNDQVELTAEGKKAIGR